MTPCRCLTVWMILVVICSTPLHALCPEDPTNPGQQIWRLAELEQKTLEQSGVMLHDTAMQRCLQSVALRLWDQLTTELSAPVVKVMMAPRADAFTYPNGYVVLTTGMLERLENEDQLAIILAHELIHYARQHTIHLYDHLRISDQTNRIRPADSSLTIVEKDVQQQVNAAEYQADREGLDIFKTAGYCEAEIPHLITTMIDDMRAQGQSKALDDMVARKIRMQAMISQAPTAGTCPSTADNGQDFRLNCIAPALMTNARAAIRHGDWGVADRCLTRYIAMKPDDARAYYLQGEIMRQRDASDDDNPSLAYYEKALKIDPQFPLVHRALGELHFKAGQYRQAKPYFETFLSLAPEDESRAFIEGYLRQCQN